MTIRRKSKSLVPSVGLWGTPVVRRFKKDFDSLFTDFLDVFNNDSWNWSLINFEDIQPKMSFPKINVSETNESYLVEIAIAGFNKEDVKLELKDNCLIMSADKKEEGFDKDQSYLKKEISSRSFRRVVRFVNKIESASADYKDGVVKVDLKKKEKADEAGSVEISIN